MFFFLFFEILIFWAIREGGEVVKPQKLHLPQVTLLRWLTLLASLTVTVEAAQLAYANKTKECITSQKLGSWYFWQIANSFHSKGKSAMRLLFNGP